MNAIEKYNTRAATVQSLVCVGLDSDFARLPPSYQTDPQPQFAFNRAIISQTHPFAAAFKLNMAFYEARGEAGLRDLRLTVDYLREQHPSILTICDAKRGDIGSTSAAYATAIFDHLGFDAVTLSPYLGAEALAPFLERADRACIILCRTSNPGAGELQDLEVNGEPLWKAVARRVVTAWNAHSNCMLVVGATYPAQMRDIRALAGDMILLVPGVGEQGGEVRAVIRSGATPDGRGLIINASRSIIFARDPAGAARELREQINLHRS